MVTKLRDLDLSKKYTYADYLEWRLEEMVELIRGRVFKMTPAPNLHHQEVSSNLHGAIYAYLKGKNCKVFHAPFDVRLPLPPDQTDEREIETVVQPDISVICDMEKLDIKGCLGAPDWIIEILSLSTSAKDLTEKFELYESAGVKEYWLVHPHEQTLLIYDLDDDQKYRLRARPYVRTDKVKVGIFEEFELDLKEIFPEHQS